MKRTMRVPAAAVCAAAIGPRYTSKVDGLWKWVNASPVHFYAHRIEWKVWSMGAVDCQTQTYRHWRAISYGHVHGVATPTATSIDITINC